MKRRSFSPGQADTSPDPTPPQPIPQNRKIRRAVSSILRRMNRKARKDAAKVPPPDREPDALILDESHVIKGRA